jgi:hypothetical protein
MMRIMRMNISVSDDLKKRMDKLDGVNWSAVACTAFIEIVNSREREKKGTNMDRVIERLRQSQNKAASEEYTNGRKAGRAWASDHANITQLKRLAKARDPIHDWCFGADPTAAYSSAECFVFIIEPDDRGDRQAVNLFWESVLGSDETDVRIQGSDDFVQGFAEAAVELWEEVQDKL